MKKFIGILLILFTLISTTTCSVKAINFDRNCTAYLKRAADANTVETAKTELTQTINYLNDNNLTKGYTSILYETPSEDIGFWYNNLKSSQLELSKVNNSTSALEKTNLLMKLRETLLDSGEKNDNITIPDGLWRYPNNLLYSIWFWTSLFLFGVGLFLLVIYYEEN
jgi:hypothetical protein